tara:strand:- start:686 stop:877 length:192 start_codon:yes stop_codon:yes gene_type:complete
METLLTPLLKALEEAHSETAYLWREMPWDDKGFELNEQKIRSIKNAILEIDQKQSKLLEKLLA